MVLALSLVFLAMPDYVSASEATVDLGTTVSFGVLAGSTITNTGPTTINGNAGGDIGVHPGTAVTGFPPGNVSGTIHKGNAEAEEAKADLVIAYNDAASRTVTENITGRDLGELTLIPGVYKFDSSAQLTGTLILDAEGDPDAVFIFQIGSTLTTASDSSVSLINGASHCRVFWQVGSSATLGTNTDFVGHVFASESITANTGATVLGQLLAKNGAVTLDSNEITNDFCESESETTPTAEETTETDTEETTTDTDTAETTTDTETAETTTDTDTAETTTDQQEIPKTGETRNYFLIGLILLGLAFSLRYILSRSRSR